MDGRLSSHFRKPLTPHTAASITRIIADGDPLPSEQNIETLHRWAFAQGIDCASHEETVAALLLPYLSLADELTEEHVHGEPDRVRQGYRDNARNNAARAIWFYDPALGDLDACVRQGIERGWARYQPLGRPRVSGLGQEPDFTVENVSRPPMHSALNKARRAKLSFPVVFGYAHDKTNVEAEYQRLKQVAYRTLRSCIDAFDPDKHGEIFTQYAHPLVFAAIDLEWIAMQQLDVQAVAADAQVASLAAEEPFATQGETAALSPTPKLDTSSVQVDASSVPESIPTLEQSSESDVVSVSDDPIVPVQESAQHQDSVPVDPPPKTVSRKRQRILDAATRRSPSGTVAEMTSAEASSVTTTTHGDDEVIDAAALAESIRKDRYIDYVKKQEDGSFVHTFADAQDHLRNTYANIAKSDSVAILRKAGIKALKTPALQKVSDAILQRAIESFNPPNSTKKLFRAHLHAMLEKELVTE